MNDEKENTSSKKVTTNKVVTSSRENRLLYNPADRSSLNYPMNYYEEENAETEEAEEDAEDENFDDEEENKEENEDVKENKNSSATSPNVEMEGQTVVSPFTFLKLKNKVILIFGIIVIFLIIIFIFILLGGITTYAGSGNYNSACNGTKGDIVSFIDSWEGETAAPVCDANNYKGYDINDGTISIGAGMTNYAISTVDMAAYIESNNWQQYFNKQGNVYRVDVGLCVPKSVINKMKLYTIETVFAPAVDDAASSLGLDLKQFQKDAIISFNYNVGSAYTMSILQAYKDGGYEGLWNAMKSHTCAWGSCNQSGLMKRRKAEFALFVTGDYSDQNLFYNRSLDNYDNYDSENVLNRRLMCTTGGNDGEFYAPLDDGFYCSEGYHWRSVHPVDGSSKQHYGLDLGNGGNAGRNVYAVKSGTIVYVYNEANCSTYKNSKCSVPACGNQVNIAHEDGTQTVYCHMQYHSIVVREGEIVSGGQVIGKVGSTGSSTGPHLHFGVLLQNGQWTDPFDYYRSTWQYFKNNNILTGDLNNCE